MNHYFLFIAAIAITAFTVNSIAHGQTPEKPNIVFILLDDLNDYTEVFNGQVQSVTPSIGNLAEEGTVFLNAFANSTKCMSSRTSLLSGKDMAYTQVYKNEDCLTFRDIFSVANDNPWVYTIGEIMKDSGGYFTYAVNKTDHCYDQLPDFDSISTDDCSRGLSWNKYFYLSGSETAYIREYAGPIQKAANGFLWHPIPDTMEKDMIDYIAIDSAISFIHEYSEDPSIACDKPVFMMIGLRKPHGPWYIPERYFSDDYVSDFYESPLDLPYNDPTHAYPPNGLIMPPQPAIKYADYLAFGDSSLSKVTAEEGSYFLAFEKAWKKQSPLPPVEEGLSDLERKNIVNLSYEANASLAYMASITFLDEQIGRLLDSVKNNNPDFYNNTIFIVTSDHGYTFGEKKNWKKSSVWETDIRVPMIIADMRNPEAQIVDDAVGLIDMFPTILDMGDVTEPLIDGLTPYLDGESIFPYLENPNINKERGIVSAIRLSAFDCNCFPQWSVRTDRFHYLYYTSNNEIFETPGCEEGAGFHDEELYELGVNREKDSEEWNNLVEVEEYGPVKEYMRSFLPDSVNYQKTMMKTSLTIAGPQCVYPQDQKIKIQSQLFDQNGSLVSGPTLLGYTFKWTNSLSPVVRTGLQLKFPFSLIDSTTFANNDHILFYLHVTDNITGELVAFDMINVAINMTSIPVVDYNLTHVGPEIFVNDFSVTGPYNNIVWTTNTGYSGGDYAPSPFTVDASGNYIFKCFTYYGNKSTCKVVTTRSISVMEPPMKMMEEIRNFRLQPNPASKQVTVSLSDLMQATPLMMYNSKGELVYETTMEPDVPLMIPCGHLPAGMYTVAIKENGTTYSKRLVISR